MSTQERRQKAQAGLLISLLGNGLFFMLFVSLVLAVNSNVREMALTDGGSVVEINMASDRKFWVTDIGAGEIWYVDVDTSSYVTYQGLREPVDARSDGRGNAWWTNSVDKTLGQLTINSSTIITWPLLTDGSPSGTAIGSNDHIWVSDSLDSRLYRFDFGSNQLCTYSVTNNGGSEYLLFSQGFLWLADAWNEQIFKVNPVTREFTAWSLASGAQPGGLALDDQNDLWWADSSLNNLGRLDVSDNSITTYDIPITSLALNDADDPDRIFTGIPRKASPEDLSFPIEVAPRNGKIWFTDWFGRVGSLDTLLASGLPLTTTVSNGTMPAPECQAVEPLSTSTANKSSGSIQWADNSYNLVKDSDGWLIYQLPGGGSPQGIAADAGNVWFTDQGRQVVGRFELLSCFELTKERTGSGSPPLATPGSSSVCPPDNYLEGAEIGLQAAPSSGWKVDHWTGTDDDSASTTTNFVTMPGSEHSVTVHYVEGTFQYLPMVMNR